MMLWYRMSNLPFSIDGPNKGYDSQIRTQTSRCITCRRHTKRHYADDDSIISSRLGSHLARSREARYVRTNLISLPSRRCTLRRRNWGLSRIAYEPHVGARFTGNSITIKHGFNFLQELSAIGFQISFYNPDLGTGASAWNQDQQSNLQYCACFSVSRIEIAEVASWESLSTAITEMAMGERQFQ